MKFISKKPYTTYHLYYFLAAVFFVVVWVWPGKFLITFLILNKYVLYVTIPFLFLFVALRTHRKITWEVMGVFIAIIVFTLSTAISTSEILREQKDERNNLISAILAINKYNCNVASQTILKLGNEGDQFPLHQYLLNVYVENIALVYKEFGAEKGNLIMESVARMQATNALIEMVQNLNTADITGNQSVRINTIKPYVVDYTNELKRLSNEVLIRLKSVSKDYIDICSYEK